jgi:hypothetical protein
MPSARGAADSDRIQQAAQVLASHIAMLWMQARCCQQRARSAFACPHVASRKVRELALEGVLLAMQRTGHP